MPLSILPDHWTERFRGLAGLPLDLKAQLTHRAVPIKVFFEELLATSEAFRHFVFLAYSKRMTELFHVIDEVAFKRIDIRLAGLLVRLADRCDGPIAVTQQDLAFEWGSAREVISRQLQEFKKRGWLELGRGSISLNDPAALRASAQH